MAGMEQALAEKKRVVAESLAALSKIGGSISKMASTNVNGRIIPIFMKPQVLNLLKTNDKFVQEILLELYRLHEDPNVVGRGLLSCHFKIFHAMAELIKHTGGLEPAYQGFLNSRIIRYVSQAVVIVNENPDKFRHYFFHPKVEKVAVNEVKAVGVA